MHACIHQVLTTWLALFTATEPESPLSRYRASISLAKVLTNQVFMNTTHTRGVLAHTIGTNNILRHGERDSYSL